MSNGEREGDTDHSIVPLTSLMRTEKGGSSASKVYSKSSSKKRHPQYRLLQFCLFLCLKYTLKDSSDKYKKYMASRYSPKFIPIALLIL